jgi:glutaconyl-CoA/methylmalonyl-CoA decarboxylase subunit gamma
MKLKVKINDQSFDVEVMDVNARPVKAVVDGEVFQVWPEESTSSIQGPCDPPVGAFTPSTPVPSTPAPVSVNVDRSKAILAPLPGVIIEVRVNEGETVEKGTELCLLEAMKMKNAIRSQRGGTIAKVFVNVGQTVRKDAPLFEFTD